MNKIIYILLKIRSHNNLSILTDIIALRNLAHAVTNPFQESNKFYSKTIGSFHKNRPFSKCVQAEQFFVVELVLLPHQVIIFPKSLWELIEITAGQEFITEWDKYEIRYSYMLNTSITTNYYILLYTFYFYASGLYADVIDLAPVTISTNDEKTKVLKFFFHNFPVLTNIFFFDFKLFKFISRINL
jgi:hypothetical protein